MVIHPALEGKKLIPNSSGVCTDGWTLHDPQADREANRTYHDSDTKQETNTFASTSTSADPETPTQLKRQRPLPIRIIYNLTLFTLTILFAVFFVYTLGCIAARILGAFRDGQAGVFKSECERSGGSVVIHCNGVLGWGPANVDCVRDRKAEAEGGWELVGDLRIRTRRFDFFSGRVEELRE